MFQIDDTEYDLPVEQNSAHTFLFGIYNAEILANLLGIIYFDQEKGWTLLNRGTIIGTNRFSIEVFFRGVKEDESTETYDMVATIKALEKKIAQYKLILNVAEYQTAINESGTEKVDDMLRILNRDFKEHQIIIASIYRYDNVIDKANVISMDGTLFDGETLLDERN